MKMIRVEVSVDVAGTNYGEVRETMMISEDRLRTDALRVGQEITRRLDLIVARRDELEHENARLVEADHGR